MVSMGLFTQALYPEFRDFVKTELPKVSNDKKKWAAFLKYSEFQGRWFGETQALWALKWGTDPVIIVKQLGSDYGQYTTATPDTIYVDKELAERFKTDHALAKAKEFMEANILHEMVHWGDWHADNKAEGFKKADEWGAKFEVAAYGKDLKRWW